MDTYEERRDVTRSVLVGAGGVGLVAGLSLLALDTLADRAVINGFGVAIAGASAVAVLGRRVWIGALVVALALVTTFVLLLADFALTGAIVASLVATAAGVVMMVASQQEPA